MKKTAALGIALLVSGALNAQIKNAAQFIEYGKMVYATAEAAITKTYWHQLETGRMDTVNWVRWVPVTANQNNAGDNIMCFYKKKTQYIDYMTLQTLNKKMIDGYKTEIGKYGYKQVEKSNKPDLKREVFSNGNINISFIEGREKKTDPISYMIGVKVLKH